MAISKGARNHLCEYVNLRNGRSNGNSRGKYDRHFIMSSRLEHEPSTDGIMLELGLPTLFHQSTAEPGITMVYDSDRFTCGMHFNT